MNDDPGMGECPSRRRVLIGASAWTAVAVLADFAATMPRAMAGGTAEEIGEAFTADHVRKLAEDLATREFAKPRVELPEPFNALTAEQYRDIRFRSEASVWRGQGLDYEVQLLPLGWLYETPVEIWIVEGGKARNLKADSASFAIGPSIEKAPDTAPFAFSVFASRAPSTRRVRSMSSSRFRARATSRPSAAASSTAFRRAASPSTRRARVARSFQSFAPSGS
jgi:glucans biosynthesis protein